MVQGHLGMNMTAGNNHVRPRARRLLQSRWMPIDDGQLQQVKQVVESLSKLNSHLTCLGEGSGEGSVTSLSE